MSEKAPILVLDTNVWLDDAIVWRQGHKSAWDLIAYARHHNVELTYAITAIKDVFYIAERQFKKYAREMQGTLTEAGAAAATDSAWDVADGLNDVATPIGMDAADVWMARKLRGIHNDLEDNLMIAAAERINADYIVTSDIKLIENPHVKAMTAEDMLTHLKLFAA
ncbi:MAG: PIN domain-containing protein [Olegusella sp.]|nr:PIN domain-containing protein [Olegusella sp.]